MYSNLQLEKVMSSVKCKGSGSKDLHSFEYISFVSEYILFGRYIQQHLDSFDAV